MRYIVSLIIIALLVFLGVLVFGGNGNKTVKPAGKTLSSYSTSDAEVRLTIDGTINGDDAHRQIVITVGRNQRELRVNKGYQGNQLEAERFSNNSDAYSAFLHSLDLAGFTKTRTSQFTSEQGQCPLGQRYIYEVINNGKDISRSWSTSCGGGTFRGQGLVRNLFQNQISNYSDYVGDVNL